MRYTESDETQPISKGLALLCLSDLAEFQKKGGASIIPEARDSVLEGFDCQYRQSVPPDHVYSGKASRLWLAQTTLTAL